MKDMRREQLDAWLKLAAGTCFVYIYTPLCGTCKVAEQMLRVVEALQPQCPLVRVNILEFTRDMDQWKIESVPCLMAVRDGVVIRKLYAFRSVDYLHREMLRMQAPA